MVNKGCEGNENLYCLCMEICQERGKCYYFITFSLKFLGGKLERDERKKVVAQQLISDVADELSTIFISIFIRMELEIH